MYSPLHLTPNKQTNSRVRKTGSVPQIVKTNHDLVGLEQTLLLAQVALRKKLDDIKQARERKQSIDG